MTFLTIFETNRKSSIFYMENLAPSGLKLITGSAAFSRYPIRIRNNLSSFFSGYLNPSGAFLWEIQEFDRELQGSMAKFASSGFITVKFSKRLSPYWDLSWCRSFTDWSGLSWTSAGRGYHGSSLNNALSCNSFFWPKYSRNSVHSQLLNTEWPCMTGKSVFNNWECTEFLLYFGQKKLLQLNALFSELPW